jgi:hypothetical protein
MSAGIGLTLVASCAARGASRSPDAATHPGCPAPVAVLSQGAVEPSRGNQSKFFADGSVLREAQSDHRKTEESVSRFDPTRFERAVSLWRKHACCKLGMHGGDTWIGLEVDGCEVILETEQDWRRRSPACWAVVELLSGADTTCNDCGAANRCL